MKRLNPETNQPFERGYKRQDGRYFFQYNIQIVKRNGFFQEIWLSEIALNRYKKTQRKVKKIYAKNNPDKTIAKSNKRRAKKLQRIPRWIKDVFVKEIAEYYAMAKELEKIFPWKQHVDHIIPLQGKNVSGLHVPWNLQILSKKANLEKGNKYVDEINASYLPTANYRQIKKPAQLSLILTTGAGENDDDANDYLGAVQGENAYRRAKEGC